MAASRLRSFPSARRMSSCWSSSTTAMPAESYPRYSSFLNPSRMTGTTCLFPTYPTIPHIVELPLSKLLTKRPAFSEYEGEEEHEDEERGGHVPGQREVIGSEFPGGKDV